jgi:hypothetical protein
VGRLLEQEMSNPSRVRLVVDTVHEVQKMAIRRWYEEMTPISGWGPHDLEMAVLPFDSFGEDEVDGPLQSQHQQANAAATQEIPEQQGKVNLGPSTKQ